MKNILLDNYRTYYNSRTQSYERHVLRLVSFLLLAFFLSYFYAHEESGVFSMMITGVTILTGFSFTALFSDHAQADVGLTKPKNENDVVDIDRLGKLAENFRARSIYFISLSIIEVVVLVMISLDFKLPLFIGLHIDDIIEKYALLSNLYSIFVDLSGLLLTAVVTVAFFIFFECLYTFYRLTETIIAILDARRNYLKIRK